MDESREPDLQDSNNSVHNDVYFVGARSNSNESIFTCKIAHLE